MNQKPTGSLGGLLISQFFGAFNDHAWKMMVALLAINAATKGLNSSGQEYQTISQSQTTMAFVIFNLPLALFSLPAGLLADRVSKRSVIIFLKVVEIGLMIAAAASLFYGHGDAFLPLIILGLMGVQAALFSPSKYGILPEILPHDQLSAGNGALEMWTFLAIIGGTGAGGLLLDLFSPDYWRAALLLIVFAIIGFIASLKLPDVPVARTEGGFFQTISGAWNVIKSDRVLWLSVWGSVFFWTTVSLVGQDILVYAKALTLGWSNSDTFSGLPMAFFGIGVGIGSFLAGRMSGQKVEYGLLPLGAIGIAIFTFLLGAIGPGYFITLLFMVFLGISSGFVVVPLDAILQWRSPAATRGGVIALANVFIFAGIMCGSLGAGALSNIGFSARAILGFSSILTFAGTAWVLWLLPDFLVRFIFVILSLIFYRLTVLGRENIPETGGALLVPNHVSFIDGFLIMASIERPVRFIVDEIYYNNFLLHPLMKTMRAIPVSATGGIRVILKALRDAGNFLDQGDLVCIFAEGQVTRIGMLLPFKRGLERIVKGRNVPIIPVNLDRLWGSIYSRAHGRFITKLPEKYPYPITITIGSPMPASTPAYEIRRVVQELGVAAWDRRKDEARPLHHFFIKTMRTRPWRFAFGEAARPKISRLGVLAGTIAVARALKPHWANQEYVGIMLPPCVAAAMVNIAASISGKVSVNLNFTAGRSGMASAARQTQLKTIVTSKAFLEKAKLELPENAQPIFMEDIAAGIGFGSRLLALLISLTTPISMIEKICGALRKPKPDDIATIIFSSGSTGEPKGVMLSHYNVDSNTEGVGQVLQVGQDDKLLGVLPLFHSFGYMSLWFSIKFGMGIFFHANPLDAAKIGEFVEQHGITFLIATPTFLQIYMRRAAPGQFGNLRIVFTGAEKLSERLALAFEEKFGIKPIEGYGATECSPAISVSTLDYRGPGIYQVGSRRGFVGHPIPGIAIRVVDTDTGAPLPPGKPGMLLVKGPGIMSGYIGREDLTHKAIKDGWYTTGDVAFYDEDGFLKITDRLSRFSKIGGEMVPHGKVEDSLHEAAGSDVQVFAVTAVPDERKGESLAVLHTLDETKIPAILEKMVAAGLPNLFIPKKDNFIKVEKIPLLGTGKVDLRSLKQLAMEKLCPPR